MKRHHLLFFFLIITIAIAEEKQQYDSIYSLYSAFNSLEVTDATRIDLIRLALDSQLDFQKHTVLEAGDAARLLVFAANIPYVPDANLRNEALEQRLEIFRDLGLDKLIYDPQPDNSINSSLLFLSAGLLGMEISQVEIMRILDNASIPPPIRIVAMDALLLQETIDPSAIAILKANAKDPWMYIVYDHFDSGPRNVYPLREKAYEALMRLGVECHKIITPIGKNEFGEIETETIIKFDSD